MVIWGRHKAFLGVYPNHNMRRLEEVEKPLGALYLLNSQAQEGPSRPDKTSTEGTKDRKMVLGNMYESRLSVWEPKS